MIEVTEKNAHALHKELWDWLAKNPDKYEEGWPRSTVNGGDVYLFPYCSAPECCIASIRSGLVNAENLFQRMKKCKQCPIKWNGGRTCVNHEAEYFEWKTAVRENKYCEASRLAATIRDMEWHK